MSDLFDFEVDALTALPSATVAELAAQQCFGWWMTAKPARRDVIARAFYAVLPAHALKHHDFEAFRLSWIAEFRRLEVSEPSAPEEFFNKQITCGCVRCAQAA